MRVLDASGEVVGAGFLIGPDLVATCAHVVAEAVGADAYSDRTPDRRVRVDLPIVQGAEDAPGPLGAAVLRWSPIRPDGTGDVAVLRLERAVPAGARMPPLRRVDELWDHRFRVLGFPDGQRDGVWSTGRIRGEQGTRWFQLQSYPGDQSIVPGFSGSPVWDEASGAVVGMTVAADTSADTTTAYLVPIDQVLGLDPELLPCPYRGLEPFGEEHAAFFFGRDADVDRLADALERQPLVAVAGPSGVGKSSLVRAGLMPRLRESGVRIVELRAAAGVAPTVAVEVASVAVRRPEPAPPGAAGGGAGQTDVVVSAERATDPRVVLFVDQFEELADADPPAARELLLQLTELVRDDAPGPPVRVVLTVRWESLTGLMSPPTGDPARKGMVLDAGAALVAGAVIVSAMDRYQLRQAIVGPAERAPGLSFDPGLVDRIIDDAGAEPGQLPLVESLLTELWTRREGGSLTMAAYKAAGGVAGAVAKRAEELLAEFPDDAVQVRLRRIFTLLTRPDRDGRFVRRPVPLADLAPELRELVPRLVAGRLLVVRPAPDGAEILEPAHQSLIEHWPRLKAWLAEDRNFLAWRAELSQQRERWDSADQDPGALLRGSALAGAHQWLPARAADVSAADQEYVRRSRARQQREVRRWRVFTAVLAVLVLAAGALAVVAYDRGNSLDRQLRAANAESLGRESLAREPTDPDLAVRLALAAWRSDPTNPQARAALATAYLANQSVTRIHPDVTDRPIESLLMSADGDVLAVAGDRDPIVVVTGLAGPAPQRWAVPGLPQGTWLVLSANRERLVTGGGGAPSRLWDVNARTSVELPLEVPAESLGTLVTGGNGDRLAWLTPPSPTGRAVVVWDIGTQRPVPHALPPITDPTGGVVLGPDPDVVLYTFGAPADGPTQLVVRALSTGAELRSYGENVLTAGYGAGVVVACQDGPTVEHAATVSVLEPRSGRELRRLPTTHWNCSALRISRELGHLIEILPQPPRTDVIAVRVVGLSDGRSHDATIPPGPDVEGPDPRFQYAQQLGVVATPSGAVEVLQASGRSVLRFATTTEPDHAWLISARSALVEGGTRVLAQGGNGYGLFDRASGRLIDSRTTPWRERGRFPVFDDAMFQLDDNGSRWVLSRLGPGFTPTDAYHLPAPADPDARGTANFAVQDDRLYAMSDGLLSLWDARTRTMVAGPFALAGGPSESPADLEVRPGRPDEVAVVNANGDVELWDLAEGTQLGVFRSPDDQPYQVFTIGFTADGNRLATATDRQTLEVWDVESHAPARPSIPLPHAPYIVGFDADGYLILGSETESAGRRLMFWDLDAGREAGSMRLTFHHTGALSPDRKTLALDGIGGVAPTQLATTAGQWRDHLCAFADRPFQDYELDALPPGADAGSPCVS